MEYIEEPRNAADKSIDLNANWNCQAMNMASP